MESSEFTELIPGLPEELALECMTQLPYTAHRLASCVFRRWRHLLQNRDFYYHRKKSGFTHKIACLVQALPTDQLTSDRRKSSSSPVYGLTVFDPVTQTWTRLDSIPKYPSGLPLFCQIASCEGKLIVMGGWDSLSYEPCSDVFVYDFTRCGWRQGKGMPCKRSFFAIGSFENRVYVAGGHDENKNALKSAWVYDVNKDEWTELSQLSQERDECEGLIIGDEFWVVSGYGTERQGMFEDSAEVYEFGSGDWKQVNGVWEVGRCPRSCVGVGKDGRLVSWAEWDSAVRVGLCGVMLGSRVLVTGSEYQGGVQGFYMVEMEAGQNGKLNRISVPDEYSGFVQSGCCVEI